MSILPIHTQGSNSSSSSSLSVQNTTLNHGNLVFDRTRPQSASSGSDPVPFCASFDIGGSQSVTVSPSSAVSGPMEPVAEVSAISSKEVRELGASSGEKSLSDENINSNADGLPIGRGRGVGSSQSRAKLSGNIGTSRNKKSNGNHLLNFHYDPIARPQTRAPPPRRQQKVKPYNKDLFLQANYKFVVLDSGNYTPEKMDPDKMLQWEDIICVRYSTPSPVQCPICLDYPLCPQITSCGHIFCFPCILQYLLMGDEDHKGNCWKRCPLCFVMISPKELYTISIENVEQYSVGDAIEFMLLNRQKDSSTISQRNKPEINDTVPYNDTVYDSFSKLTFTTDVELSVRKAFSELDSWLVKADSGLVDDIEKLPYVCAAMEQLEQRKKYWNEARTKKACENTDCPAVREAVLPTLKFTNFAQEEAFAQGAPLNNSNVQNKGLDNLTPKVVDGETCLVKYGDVSQSLGGEDKQPPSNGAGKCFPGELDGSRDITDENSYNFYQAVDGQHLILHPLNMKCLLHHYGNIDMLPCRISGKILQLETVTQTEAIRKRYRYLSHFSLTTTFQLCEIDMSGMLPPNALSPFSDEIKKRENQRKRLAVKEEKEKIKAEAASDDYYVALRSNSEPFYYGNSPKFTTDDFEALGSSPVTSSSPPTVWGGTLFSNVARLGYAAGHDSPALKIEDTHSSRSTETTSPAPSAAGLRNASGLSFANIISREKSKEITGHPKINEVVGKKGKKPSRVLLSTAGGRRY